MQVLRPLIVWITILLITNCTSRTDLTHQGVFLSLKKIYAESNHIAFKKIISKNSDRSLQRLSHTLSSYSDELRSNIYHDIGLNSADLSSEMLNNYILLYFFLNKNVHKDIIALSILSPVISIKVNNSRALYTMANGKTLIFVKEDIYWKFDLEQSLLTQ